MKCTSWPTVSDSRFTRAADRPVRFGVVGCGVIAYWTHLRELRRLDGAQLVAAADPDAGARARAGRAAGIPVYEAVEDLLARPDIDAVVISVPTKAHADIAVAGIAARKHVYIEKPLATSAEDAGRVLTAAARTGVTAVVGFNRRHHPSFLQARALIAGGVIGDVKAVHSAFCEPIDPSSMPAWKKHRATGGGVLLDLGSHHVDLLRWLLDDEIAGVAARITSDRSEQDTAWLRCTMARGAEAHGFFSFNAGRTDFVEVIGERGTIRVDRHRAAPVLQLARRHGYGVRRAFLAPRLDAIRWQISRLARPSYESSYRHALRAFVAVVRGETAQVATLLDGWRSLEAILAAEAGA
jgi:predicted dehydrogenase